MSATGYPTRRRNNSTPCWPGISTGPRTRELSGLLPITANPRRPHLAAACLARPIASLSSPESGTATGDPKPALGRRALWPSSGKPWASSIGCCIQVEPARVCSPHAPPALFTGTGRSTTRRLRPLDRCLPQLKGIHVGRGIRLSCDLVDQQRAAVGRSGPLSAWLFIDGRGTRPIGHTHSRSWPLLGELRGTR